MDDKNEYAAFRIPQRETTSANEPTQPVAVKPVYAATQFSANFAEIEIGAPPFPNTLHSAHNAPYPAPNAPHSDLNASHSDSNAPYSVPYASYPDSNTPLSFLNAPRSTLITKVPQAQPIQPRISDPIREKFYEMRRLASNKPFARNDSELFYRQAKFMEEFTDDYEPVSGFNMYYPYYQHMGYDYLRTYFTWRTKVRRGEIQPISLSYIFLYIYELLSGIGTDSPADGLSKLLAIWDTFSKENPTIEKYLPKWLKDYHIFYVLPQSFSEFAEERRLQRYYSLTLLFADNTENKLGLWNGVSGYDVESSKFYKEGNEELFSNCFNAVYSGIQDFCVKRNTRFEDLLIYSVSRRSPWQPFKQALFGNRVRQTDREVIISEYERYYCKNSEWTANLPIYYSSQKDFVGYIIKKTEACLRQAVNYKYKLVAEIKPGGKPFMELKRPAAKRAELDKVIEKAVADFYRDLTRTVVEVDFHNLARIRREAKGTQDSLLVPEDELHDRSAQLKEEKGGAATSAATPATTPAATQAPTPASTPDHDEEATGTAIHSDTQQSEPAELTMSYSDGWKALKGALTDIERKALFITLQGVVSIKAFADENSIMLEVLADCINEKAADCIGDSILELEDEMIIYDEYREEIVRMVGAV